MAVNDWNRLEKVVPCWKWLQQMYIVGNGEKQESSENDGRFNVYDGLEFKVFSLMAGALTAVAPTAFILRRNFWIILKQIGTVFTILNFFAPIEPFWTVSDHIRAFGLFWTILDHIGPY